MTDFNIIDYFLIMFIFSDGKNNIFEKLLFKWDI